VEVYLAGLADEGQLTIANPHPGHAHEPFLTAVVGR